MITPVDNYFCMRFKHTIFHSKETLWVRVFATQTNWKTDKINKEGINEINNTLTTSSVVHAAIDDQPEIENKLN